MQKAAYEMRISNWSSDVCSSDLGRGVHQHGISLGIEDCQAVVGSYPCIGSGHSGTAGICRLSQTGEVRWETSVSVGSDFALQIGRASCRGRVCQYVSISGVAVPVKTKTEHEVASSI